MLEPDFIDCLAEQRINALSGKQDILREEDIVKEIMNIFGKDMDLDRKTSLMLLVDRLKNEEKAVYEKGMEDGIRLAKLVYGLSV